MWPELKEEIGVELGLLGQLLAQFAALRERVRSATPDLVESAALATFLHSFYNGVENVFRRVESHTEDQPFPRREDWHRTLLGRMAVPAKNRPAVLSGPLHDRLLRYLNFRHVFRHAYTFQLQWGKMAPLVLDARDVFDGFEREIRAFLDTAAPPES